MSWSIARITSTETPFSSRMRIERSARARVFEGWGERVSVQLM
jgi:hypothetical protein